MSDGNQNNNSLISLENNFISDAEADQDIYGKGFKNHYDNQGINLNLEENDSLCSNHSKENKTNSKEKKINK